jgi:hypothetical protein
VAEWGRVIAKEYFAKGEGYPLIMEERGLVVGEEHSIDALLSVFGSVKTEGELDYPGLWPYYSPKVVRWLRSRGLADPSKELLMQAQGGLMQPWGFGRELIPALCLTPEELPVFVHLPLAHSLPVEYVRGKTLPSGTGLREGVEGPSLWDECMMRLLQSISTRFLSASFKPAFFNFTSNC